MACLVTSDGNACDRTARTVGVREIQVVILRVVMVGELTGDTLDTHGATTVGIEHAASDRGTRIAVRANLGPGFVRRVDIVLCGKAKHRADKNNQQVQRVDAKAVSIVIGHANSFESSYTLEAFYPLSRLGFPTGARFCRPSPSTPYCRKADRPGASPQAQSANLRAGGSARDAQCSRPGHRARQ